MSGYLSRRYGAPGGTDSYGMRPNRRPEFQLGSWRIPVSRQRQPSRLEVPEWAAEEIADGFRRMRDEPDMLERLGIRDQLAAARRREIEERYAE